MIEPAELTAEIESWQHAGEVAAQAVADYQNNAKDKADQRLDAMRVHNGMTLDDYLAQA